MPYEPLFTGQREQEPDDDTRAPDYTPAYHSIFGVDNTCDQCVNTPTTTPRPPSTTATLPNSGLNANILLNTLLNQPSPPMPQPAPAHDVMQSTRVNLSYSPHTQLNQSMQPTVSQQPTHQYQAQAQQQRYIVSVPSAHQHGVAQQQQLYQHQPHQQQQQHTYQQQRPPSSQQQHQQLQVQVQQQHHQQQQQHHQQQQQQQHHQLQHHQQQQHQPQHHQLQQHHQLNNSQQQQQQQHIAEYSPQPSPLLNMIDEAYISPSTDLSQQTYNIGLLSNLYYQNRSAPIVPAPRYQPPQPIPVRQYRPPNILSRPTARQRLGARLSQPAAHNNQFQASTPQYQISQAIRVPSDSSQTGTPQSLANLQRTLNQPINQTATNAAPPSIRPPTKTYQRQRPTNSPQTVMPQTVMPQNASPNLTANIPGPTTVPTVIPPTITNNPPANTPTAISAAPKDTSAPAAVLTNDTTVPQITPVSVSSTTLPPNRLSEEVCSNHVETANKACQVRSFAVSMVHKSLSASVETVDKDCQTDIKQYVDRASSPIFFPNPSVRTKSTPKRKRPETRDDSESDEEIQVC